MSRLLKLKRVRTSFHIRLPIAKARGLTGNDNTRVR